MLKGYCPYLTLPAPIPDKVCIFALHFGVSKNVL